MPCILRKFSWATTFSKLVCVFTFLHRSNSNYKQLHAADSFLRNEEHFNSWRNSLHCIKPEGSYRVQKNIYLSLSWARSIQSMPQTQFTKIHCNILLSKLLSSKRSLSHRFPRQNLHTPLLAYKRVISPAYLILPNLITCTSPLYAVSSRPPPQPVFFPHCQTASFTRPQNIIQSHSSALLNVHTIVNKLEDKTAWTEYQ